MLEVSDRKRENSMKKHFNDIKHAKKQLEKGLTKNEISNIDQQIKDDWKAVGTATASLATKKGKNLERKTKTPAGILAIGVFFAAIAKTAKLNHQKTLAGRVTTLRKALIALRAYESALDNTKVTQQLSANHSIKNAVGKNNPGAKGTLLSGIKNERNLALGVGIPVIAVTGSVAAVILKECLSMTNNQLGIMLAGVAAAIAVYAIVSMITAHCRIKEAKQIADNTLPKNHREFSLAKKKLAKESQTTLDAADSSQHLERDDSHSTFE